MWIGFANLFHRHSRMGISFNKLKGLQNGATRKVYSFVATDPTVYGLGIISGGAQGFETSFTPEMAHVAEGCRPHCKRRPTVETKPYNPFHSPSLTKSDMSRPASTPSSRSRFSQRTPLRKVVVYGPAITSPSTFPRQYLCPSGDNRASYLIKDHNECISSKRWQNITGKRTFMSIRMDANVVGFRNRTAVRISPRQSCDGWSSPQLCRVSLDTTIFIGNRSTMGR